MQYTQAWEKVTTDSWVLEIIREGYSLEFATWPEEMGPRTTPNSWNLQSPVQLKTLELLQKGAIQEVPSRERNHGWFSTFFLRPKRTCQEVYDQY